MSSIPVIVGDRTFASKAALKKQVRALLDPLPVGSFLRGEAFALLHDLIVERHPEASAKVGPGIRALEVWVVPEFRTRGLRLLRSDGTSTDVSWTACVDGRSARQDVTSAFRGAVAHQIISFKEEALAARPTCPYRGVVLTRSNSDVDHLAPDTFESLLLRFLDGTPRESVAISTGVDNQVTSELLDPDVRRRWVDFHRRHARLRLISSAANRSEARAR